MRRTVRWAWLLERSATLRSRLRRRTRPSGTRNATSATAVSTSPTVWPGAPSTSLRPSGCRSTSEYRQRYHEFSDRRSRCRCPSSVKGCRCTAEICGRNYLRPKVTGQKLQFPTGNSQVSGAMPRLPAYTQAPRSTTPNLWIDSR